MKINLPETGQERVVIIGAGFAGLTLARKLAKSDFQVVIIDKNNYHQFQPLFYQVAMAGLEPSSIAFPLRKLFQGNKNLFIRVCEAHTINTEQKCIDTSSGVVNYDYLVIAIGADTNFYGNSAFSEHTIPMKSVSEALYLRNRILGDYETSLTVRDYDSRQGLIDIVIVGGGPTGVEVAGALAEMKKYVIPKDYPELDAEEIDIYLVQSSDRLLPSMSEAASDKALKFLRRLEVKVILGKRVTDYNGNTVKLSDGATIPTDKVIWAAGVKGNFLEGFPEEVWTRGNRLKVNRFNQIQGYESIFAIGDIAYMEEENWPNGQPQVAQTAMQHAKVLAKNLKLRLKDKSMHPFRYKDLGSMATIGRNRAVVDLPRLKFQGAFAWYVWLAVHLFQILGVKNKLFIFINWLWNYLFYDQSLRLIIKAKTKADNKVPEDKR